MVETPVILSHNVLKDAVITGECRDGYPPWRIADGLRWTWWEGVSASTHYIDILVANMLQNGDLELGTDGWFVHKTGSAGGTFSRNTANPIDGAADGLIDVAAANDTGDTLMVISLKPFFLKAGLTYRFSFAARADAPRSFRYGFARGDLAEESYTDISLGANVTELHHDFTPSSDGAYRVYWRPLEAGDFYVDDAHLCEARDVDTVAIDRGHTLQGYMFEVKKADTAYSGASYTTWHSNTMIASESPVYSTVETAMRGVQWQVKIQSSGISGLSSPQVTLLWIGERWTLPHNFSGKFDPRYSKTSTRLVRGECGVESRTLRFSQRIIAGELRNLAAADYENIEKFMLDTDDGVLPFVLLWRPESRPDDMLVMRLEHEVRNVPYRGGYFRDWPFRAVELGGVRKL